MSGVFTNRPALAEKLVAAGRASGERVWNFPFDEDYDSDLESKVADIVQCAVEGKGDHILAARFLSRFVPEDSRPGRTSTCPPPRARGGLGHVNTDITGFGVRYTLELLLDQNVLQVSDATNDARSRCAGRMTGTCTCATAHALRAVLPFTARAFARAIVMPNLKPPVTTTELALAYRQRILERCRPARASSR